MEEISDMELHEMVEESRQAESFLHSDYWRFMEKLAKRVSERVDREFAMKADPTDTGKIWELKITKKFFKYQLKSEIEAIIQDGNDALNELSQRHGNPNPQTGIEEDS